MKIIKALLSIFKTKTMVYAFPGKRLLISYSFLNGFSWKVDKTRIYEGRDLLMVVLDETQA